MMLNGTGTGSGSLLKVLLRRSWKTKRRKKKNGREREWTAS